MNTTKTKIFKYPVPIYGVSTFEVTMPAKALCVQVQHGKPVLWIALGESPDPPERVTVMTIGTGAVVDLPDAMRYLGTFQLNEGYDILHTFVSENI